MPDTPQERQRRLIDGYINIKQTAHELGISVRTLQRHWAHGDGPPRLKLGGRIHVPIEDLKAWLKSRCFGLGGLTL